MTAHVHLVKQEADEAEALEEAAVGLPGETRSSLAGLPGDNKEPVSSRVGFEAVLRALLPHRRARPARDAEDETPPTGDGAQSDEAAPEGSPSAPASEKRLIKSLLKRPVVIGAAAAVLAASLPAIVLFSSSNPPRPVVAEPGMQAQAPQPQRELMAPAAALATVPKREAALEAPARPVPPGDRSDQLLEVLALRVEPKNEPKKATAEEGKKGTEALDPVTSAQQAVSPAKTDAPAPPMAPPAKAGKEAREPALTAEGTVKIAPAVAVDPIVEARREAAEAAARRAAVKEQTQVLEKMTQLGALVAHLSEQVNELQAKVKTLSDGSEEKFADLGRRIALGEANRTLSAAEAAQTAAPARSGASTLALPRDQGEPAPQPAKPVRAAAKAAPAAAETETPRRYRVQAASPGLAMLAAIGGGEDDAPLQVAVGAKVPGYGRITSIEQRGAAWVVQTERGAIQ